VRDAARNPDPPQGCEYGILRPAHMEDDRQIMTTRQPELRNEECLLPRNIKSRYMTIQPDFPYGYGATLRKQGIERIEIGFIGAIDSERMNAERRKNAGGRSGQRQHARKPFAVDGRHDKPLDARRARPCKQRRAIRIELDCVEMKVRVDQHNLKPFASAVCAR